MKARSTVRNNQHPGVNTAGVFGCLEAKSLINTAGQKIWGRKVRSNRGMCYVFPGKPKSKTDCVRWNGNIDASTRMFFADFDTIPAPFGGRRGSWKAFASMLKSRVGMTGVVFRSFSGKVKVGFMFGIGVTKSSAIAEMRSIIGEDVFAHADMGATDHTIVTYNCIDAINAHIASGCVLSGHDDNAHGWSFKNTPVVMEAIKRFKRKSVRAVYHWLLSYRSGSMDLYMPVRKIADDCGISISSASLAISVLEQEGVIRCIDSSYIVGKKAKMYRVICQESLVLMDAKEGRTFDHVADVNEGMFYDGNWFKALWYHTRFFETGVEFMLFVCSIPGAYEHRKRRISKARSAWRSHARRNGLSVEVV